MGECYKNISFKLKEGEILGFAGLNGCGNTELFETIIGLDSTYEGNMYLNGIEFKPKSTKEAINKGIVYVPPERRTDSIIPQKSICYNMVISNLRICVNKYFVSEKKVHKLGDSYLEKMKIKAISSDQGILELSGGNQQKVVFSRALATNPKILVLNEPTKGIDVGAKHEIYLFLQELASKGLGILVISTELDELMAVSDRVVAFHQGLNVAEFIPEEIEKKAILDAIMGKKVFSNSL